MATFIALIDFTETGIQNVKDTTRRVDEFEAAAKSAGAQIKSVYWTLGAHDGVLIFEAPDDETASAVLLHLGSLGQVRTLTMRAFNRTEIEKILAKTGTS